MSATANNCIKLAKLPSIKLLMLRSLLKKSNKQSSPILPSIAYCVENVSLAQDKLALFHQVVNWQGDKLHPCYIHTLAFPLHLKLLVNPQFPFPLLGLVHVKNTIQQFRAIQSTENLSITCHLAELVAHPKGWVFSIISECTSDNDVVWRSTSVNLYRTQHPTQVTSQVKSPIAEFSGNGRLEHWHLATNLGRLYAKASGDYNPIHLAKWSAKLFGFKQQIIHGMWTKSRCISTLQVQEPAILDSEFSVQVGFKLPLFLPSEVVMTEQAIITEGEGRTIHFKVESQQQDQQLIPHLVGSIRFI